MEYQGSGGNHMYKFVNAEYLYEVFINQLGENETPETILSVKKYDRELMSVP